MVSPKTDEEIDLMRRAGEILCRVLDELAREIKPGMTTKRVDELGEEIIRSYGCVPSFKGYEGYPGSVCVSIDDEIVHGIPNPRHILREGNIVSLDTGVIYRGWQSDAARTVPVGEIPEEAARLIRVTKESFFAGMRYARAGFHIRDIGTAVQRYAEKRGYSVVRELTGHGIGREMHEDPAVPNFRTFRRGIRLKQNMTIAVEPMINEGSRRVAWMDDGWTVVTLDGSRSAHYENTIRITSGRPELLSYPLELMTPEDRKLYEQI